MNYSSLTVDVQHGAANVSFNRPDKANALDSQGWEDLQAVFEDLSARDEVRVVVLSGNGKHFCSGIDLSMLAALRQGSAGSCEGRKREAVRAFIRKLQAPINAIEDCRKPVLAAIHGGCIGAGVDIVCACDMRYCSDDAYFSIREVDMGLVADLGTLQRLPKLVSPGMVAEMAYTGANLAAAEAARIGLVNRVYSDATTLLEGVLKLARSIAEKPPLVIRGTKEMLLYSRDHSVADALGFVATWNAAMLLSNDLDESFQAFIEKRKPEFGD